MGCRCRGAVSVDWFGSAHVRHAPDRLGTSPPQRRQRVPMGVHGAQDHSVPNTTYIARLTGNSRSCNISSVHTRVVWIGAVSALEAGLSFCQSIRNDNNIMTVISTRIHPGVCIMISSSKAMSVCLSSGAPG